eukprot:Mrub_01861.p1 GENE.Mrub_01861~~Mrub_01861.p1  ORF type:complete len:626 (+),score=78.55 Mrub_01861:2-1879(+)
MSRLQKVNKIIQDQLDDMYIDDYDHQEKEEKFDPNQPYITEVRQYLKDANVSDKYIIKTLKQFNYATAETVSYIFANHDSFKAKNKCKNIKDINENKKPKSLTELMKSFSDVISVSDFVKQFKSSSQTYEIKTNTESSSKDSNPTTNSYEISLVVIGHVDAGKSTLVGRLMGNVMADLNREFEKYKNQAKMIGKTSFAYAWNTDGMSEERERGITIDYNEKTIYITQDYLKNNKEYFMFDEEDEKNKNKMMNCDNDYYITFYDCPGHRDFVSNMIGGTSNADAAMLVVDVVDFSNNYEWGSFKFKSQTIEHLKIIKSLGIFQLIVAFNKIDKIEGSQNVNEKNDEKYSNKKVIYKDYIDTYLYENLEDEFLSYLTKHLGFKKNNISFVKCSGFLNWNLDKIISKIGSFKLRPPMINRPMYLSVNEFYNQDFKSKPRIYGKLTEGSIEVNQGKTHYYLTNNKGYYIKTKILSIDGKNKGTFSTCKNYEIEIDFSNKDVHQFISSPCILCDPNYPIKMTSRFIGSVQTFELKYPITQGQSMILFLNNFKYMVKVSKLISLTEKEGMNESKRMNPRCISSHKLCELEISLTNDEYICLEMFETSKLWGRFMLRHDGSSVGCGMVVKIF